MPISCIPQLLMFQGPEMCRLMLKASGPEQTMMVTLSTKYFYFNLVKQILYYHFLKVSRVVLGFQKVLNFANFYSHHSNDTLLSRQVSLFFWIKFIYLFRFLKKFYYYSITVACISCPSLHPTPAKPTSLPHLCQVSLETQAMWPTWNRLF